MRNYEFKRERLPDGSPLGLQAKFHTMERDGICFGCGRPVGTGTEVYRIDMLAGKSKYVNFCNKCQMKISNDIRSQDAY